MDILWENAIDNYAASCYGNTTMWKGIGSSWENGAACRRSDSLRHFQGPDGTGNERGSGEARRNRVVKAQGRKPPDLSGKRAEGSSAGADCPSISRSRIRGSFFSWKSSGYSHNMEEVYGDFRCDSGLFKGPSE